MLEEDDPNHLHFVLALGTLPDAPIAYPHTGDVVSRVRARPTHRL
jgi:hypothetical protein